jgi:pimeloyl-ACP methyl ester carboxylesterase
MKRWTVAVLVSVACQFSTAAQQRDAFAGVTVPVSTAVVRPIARALEQYEGARARVEAELGVTEAAVLHARLFDDLELQTAPAPEGYSAADWADTVASTLSLDVEAVDQLVAGTPAPLRATPGLHEVLVPSRVDKRWQLVAVYVPPSLKPGAKAPLAIALHGNPETESHLLGMPYLRRLADRTGTIVVAPYGRGIYDYEEPAGTDVYDLLRAVQDAFPIDRGRTYLVGYSMGGFTVFKIGPRGGYRWSAAMCISGAILNSGVRAVSIAWQTLRIYVVTGANDGEIPTKFGEQTAAYLASAGLPVSFYEEPHGTHFIRSLTPSLQRAWDDMHASLVRGENVPVVRAGFSLPGSAPAAVQHP